MAVTQLHLDNIIYAKIFFPQESKFKETGVITPEEVRDILFLSLAMGDIFHVISVSGRG